MSKQRSSGQSRSEDEDLDLTTPHCQQYARNDRDFDHIAGNAQYPYMALEPDS